VARAQRSSSGLSHQRRRQHPLNHFVCLHAAANQPGLPASRPAPAGGLARITHALAGELGAALVLLLLAAALRTLSCSGSSRLRCPVSATGRSSGDALGDAARRKVQRPRVRRHRRPARPRAGGSVIDELQADVVARSSPIRPLSQSKPGGRSALQRSTSTSVRSARRDSTRCRASGTRCSRDIRSSRCIGSASPSSGRPLHVLAALLGLRLHERRFQPRHILEYRESVQRTLLSCWGLQRLAARTFGRARPRPAAPASGPSTNVSGRVAAPATRPHLDPLVRDLQRVFAPLTPASRVASDHLPVVAEIDAAWRRPTPSMRRAR
jgi:hypothetical protein